MRKHESVLLLINLDKLERQLLTDQLLAVERPHADVALRHETAKLFNFNEQTATVNAQDLTSECGIIRLRLAAAIPSLRELHAAHRERHAALAVVVLNDFEVVVAIDVEHRRSVAHVSERCLGRRAQSLALRPDFNPRPFRVARLDFPADDVPDLVVVLVLVQQRRELGVRRAGLPDVHVLAHDRLANDRARGRSLRAVRRARRDEARASRAHHGGVRRRRGEHG
mmetsp:Transcript_1714/g.6803  ORF Transcript_1714/g.6803 Transcript_1714/m.6803 type:complete len:225 (+) Transcript_1714:491-1165(+)